jgi:hypothetical protein
MPQWGWDILVLAFIFPGGVLWFALLCWFAVLEGADERAG